MNLGGYSLTGPREANEDNYYTRDLHSGGRFSNGVTAFVMVSDGMGGYQGGDVASALAVESATSYLDHLLNMAQSNQVDFDAAIALGEIVQNAHEAILAVAHERGGASMGATFIGAFIGEGHAWVGHVGDSRAYLIRNGQAMQVTEDHSQVGRMLSRGLITEEEAQNHPARNRIERALGFPNFEIEISEVDLLPGDVLLLCSDGVYTVLNTAMLSASVQGARDARDAAETVVKQAIKQGTDDNSTAVVAFYDGANVGAVPVEAAAQKPTRTPGVMQTQRVAPIDPREIRVPEVGGSAPRQAGNAAPRPANRRPDGTRPAPASRGSRGRSVPVSARHAAPDPRRNSAGMAASQGAHRKIFIAVAVVIAAVIIAFVAYSCGQADSMKNETTDQTVAANRLGTQGPQPEQPNAVQTAEAGYGVFKVIAPEDNGDPYTQPYLKFVGGDGLANTFGDVFNIARSSIPKFQAGTELIASDTTDEYGRGQDYRALSDSYLSDLRNDLEAYSNDQTTFNSNLSRVVGSVEYKRFLAALNENGGKELLDREVKMLVVNGDCLERASSQ